MQNVDFIPDEIPPVPGETLCTSQSANTLPAGRSTKRVEVSFCPKIKWYDGDIFHQNYPSRYPNRWYCLTLPVLKYDTDLDGEVTFVRSDAYGCFNPTSLSAGSVGKLYNESVRRAVGSILIQPGVVSIKVTAYDIRVFIAQSFDFDKNMVHAAVLAILANEVFVDYNEVLIEAS